MIESVRRERKVYVRLLGIGMSAIVELVSLYATYCSTCRLRLPELDGQEIPVAHMPILPSDANVGLTVAQLPRGGLWSWRTRHGPCLGSVGTQNLQARTNGLCIGDQDEGRAPDARTGVTAVPCHAPFRGLVSRFAFVPQGNAAVGTGALGP